MTPLISTSLLRTQSDERLVRLAATGHERAFEAIVERYRRPLLRHARRLLGDGPRGEDVVQAAFVSAWAALHDGVEVRELRPWLYRIVHNGALNALKRAGEDHDELPATLAAGPAPEADFEQRDQVRRTLDAVAALPERQRAALLAIAVDGRPHGEVAAELGMTSGALRQLVHRARTSLRAVATAVTPGPAAAWAAGAAHDATITRIAEVAGGAGGAGLAGAALKVSAVAVTAGVIVAAAPTEVARLVSPAHRARLAAAAPRAAAPRPVAAPAAGPQGSAPPPPPRPGPARRDPSSSPRAGARHVAAVQGEAPKAPLRRERSGDRQRSGGSGSDGGGDRLPVTSTSDGRGGDATSGSGEGTAQAPTSGSSGGGDIGTTTTSAGDGGTTTTPTTTTTTDGGTGVSSGDSTLAAPSGTD